MVAELTEALLGVKLNQNKQNSRDGPGSNDEGTHYHQEKDATNNRKPSEDADPFVVLGLAPKGEGVTAAEVKKAHRKLALINHPDKIVSCLIFLCATPWILLLWMELLVAATINRLRTCPFYLPTCKRTRGTA
jgi:hypothetical protein